jgi:hypothetical protein
MALAHQGGHPHAVALATLNAGVARFFVGDWSSARTLCEQSELLLLERSCGATWELDTSRIFSLWSLFYLGEIGELARRLPQLKRNAVERGDRYGEASLSGGLPVVGALASGIASAGDVRARAEEVLRDWSRAGYHVQHQWGLIANVLCRLYAGDGLGAWDAIEASWSALERSALLRVQYVRVEARYLRAMAAIGASCRTWARAHFVAEAMRSAKRLERENVGWAAALGLLVRAGAAAIGGDGRAAERSYADAARAFDKENMALFANVARRRRGEIVGGEHGRALVAKADAWMIEQGIRSTDRFAAMLAPAPLGREVASRQVEPS